MRFRPYPGLTLFTLIASAILLSLGTWQYQRLGWKTQLLADIETASKAAPYDQYTQITQALSNGSPIDFARVKLSGEYVRGLNGKTPEFHVFRIEDKKIMWRIFRLLKTDGDPVFIAAEFVPDALKDSPKSVSSNTVYLSGYVRRYQKPSRFAAKSTPQANRWFSFNALKDTQDWGKTASQNGQIVPTEFYVDAVEISDTPSDLDLPIKTPDIPNNHFDYMLTWYSFAVILWVIYGLLHIRAGRLSLR